MNTENQVKKIISEQLGIKESEIESSSRIVDDLGADSLDEITLVMTVEDEFNLEISDDAAIKLTTVGKIIEYIDKQEGITNGKLK